MGCQIHLRVEKRIKGQNRWTSAGFYGEFCDQYYLMYEMMAGVRVSKNKIFEPRGLPNDICCDTAETFYNIVTEDNILANFVGGFVLRKDAERWVEKGLSTWENEKKRRVSDPDLHTHSWLTTQELRKCYDELPHNKLTILLDSNWLGLVSLCEGIESTGRFECRVVFAFDS